MAEGWGAEPVEQGIGGSIPFVSDLAAEFPEAQILVTGVEDPDTRAHSPNESQHLGVLHRAIARDDPAGPAATRAERGRTGGPVAVRPRPRQCRHASTATLCDRR